MVQLSEAAAGVIGALIVLTGTLATLAFQVKRSRTESSERRESESDRHRRELFVTAVSYVEGGSQRRAVGLSMLAVIWKQLDDEYLAATFQLLLTQLQYLLVHGRNRWEGHELRNMTVMLQTLLSRGRPWLLADAHAVHQLVADIDRFLADSADYRSWLPSKELRNGGHPNIAAIARFRELAASVRDELVRAPVAPESTAGSAGSAA